MADMLLKAPLKYEVKTNNRFALRFPSDVGIQIWQVISIAAPKLTLGTKEIKFMHTQSYVNTSYKWEAMAVKVRDFIAPSTTEGLIEWLRLHAESVTGRMGYNIGCAKNIELETLDPTGVVTEKWLLVNCILSTDVSFGEYSYDTDTVRELSFTIQPQYCIHLFG